jgi:hypothetical protein
LHDVPRLWGIDVGTATEWRSGEVQAPLPSEVRIVRSHVGLKVAVPFGVKHTTPLVEPLDQGVLKLAGRRLDQVQARDAAVGLGFAETLRREEFGCVRDVGIETNQDVSSRAYDRTTSRRAGLREDGDRADYRDEATPG